MKLSVNKLCCGTACIIWVVVFFILHCTIGSPFISEAHAAEGEWKAYGKGVVVDLTGVFGSQFGLMMHFKDEGDSYTSWIQFWQDQIEGSWPKMEQYGTLYQKTVKGRNCYKWVVGDNPKPESKSKPKIVVDKQVISFSEVEAEWIKADKEFPEISKVVVVRFDDDKTSTAFWCWENSKKEWKLHINVGKYRSGPTIRNIVEWKDVGL